MNLDDVTGLLEERRGTNGVGVARRALELFRAGSAGTKALTEDVLLAAHQATGGVEPAVNVRGIMGFVDIEPDFAWERERLVVECDGSGHRLPGAAERDADQDERHRGAGWRVRRFTTSQVWRRRRWVVAEIADELARGSRRSVSVPITRWS